MRAFLLSTLPFMLILPCAAQDVGKVHMISSEPAKAAPAVAVDSAGQEMEVLSKDEMKQMEWQFMGAYTEPPAHPSCAAQKGEERKSCTALQVLNEIRSRLEATPPAKPPPPYARVRVGFDVDRFGDVKQITVNYGGDDTMSEAVITALYGLPKFEAASKDATKVASHCSFSYAPALLFTKP